MLETGNVLSTSSNSARLSTSAVNIRCPIHAHSRGVFVGSKPILAAPNVLLRRDFLRGNQGWKATVGTLKDASVEFEMVWDTADAGFTAIKNAYFNNSLIGLAAMDGDITVNGHQGLWADCSIIDFSRDEPLEDAISVKVTAKPTYSANAPIWKTIGP